MNVPATFYVDGLMAAHRYAGGRPTEVLPWLRRIAPRGHDHRRLVVALALAQCDITDRCFQCRGLTPGHSGFVYDLRPGPRVHVGAASVPLPGRAEGRPFVDPDGFLEPSRIEFEDGLARVIAPPVVRTWGCLECGVRYPSHRAWASHSCPGIPAGVRRWSSPGASDEVIPADFVGLDPIGHPPVDLSDET